MRTHPTPVEYFLVSYMTWLSRAVKHAKAMDSHWWTLKWMEMVSRHRRPVIQLLERESRTRRTLVFPFQVSLVKSGMQITFKYFLDMFLKKSRLLRPGKKSVSHRTFLSGKHSKSMTQKDYAQMLTASWDWLSEMQTHRSFLTKGFMTNYFTVGP